MTNPKEISLYIEKEILRLLAIENLKNGFLSCNLNQSFDSNGKVWFDWGTINYTENTFGRFCIRNNGRLGLFEDNPYFCYEFLFMSVTTRNEKKFIQVNFHDIVWTSLETKNDISWSGYLGEDLQMSDHIDIDELLKLSDEVD